MELATGARVRPDDQPRTLHPLRYQTALVCRSIERLRIKPDLPFYFLSDLCLGLSLVLVAARSWSSFSFIDSYIDLDAPFRSPTFFSPSLAASAIPAACC